MDDHLEITVSNTTPSKNSIDFIIENISSTIENNTETALIPTSTDIGDVLKPNRPIIIRGLKNEFIPEGCLQPEYLECPSPKSLQISKLKHENSLEIEIENSSNNIDDNIQILEDDCIIANTEILGDIDASFNKELITEDCLALTNADSKIEITEHNLELENMQVLEDIYRSYNEKHTDKKETENEKKKSVPIEKFQRLFIRLERVDISANISNQVCTSSADDINFSVCTESYVGDGLKTDGNKVRSISMNASKNKLSVHGEKAASKKSALNADTIIEKINKSTVNTDVLGDIDASFREEFITQDCLAFTNADSKIEITEHNLELENMQVLEDIYRSYNENESNKSVSNNLSENSKYKIGKRKKPVDKCKSWKKKKVQKNTLDSFVHKIKHTDKKETEKKKKSISIEKFEKLFIRLERIDISENISNQVCTSSTDDINLSVSAESYVGNKVRSIPITSKNEKILLKPLNASKNKLPVHGKKAASKKSALNAYTIKENLSGYEERKNVEGNLPKINKSTVSSGGKRRKKNVIKQGKPLRNGKKENAGEFKCYHCSTVVKYRRNLLLHMRQYHKDGEKKFKCNSCFYETNLKQALEYHTYRVHTSDSDKTIFNCKLCSFESTYKGSLSSHIDRVHLKIIKMKKCNQCNWEGDRNKHISHVRKVHLVEEYFCDKCNYKSKYKGSLVTHMNIHNDVKEFDCPKCPYQARSKTTLAAHLKSHENIFVKCPHCRQLVKKHYFYNHLRWHKNRLKKECPQCGKEVFCLANHLLTHSGSKKIKCPQCSYSCVNSGYLKNHIRRCHDNENHEVFICYHCNSELVDKRGLTIHIQTVHAKDKPFECHICGSKFKSKNYLRNHIRKTHNSNSTNCTKWFECDLCPEEGRYKTKFKGRLKWHRVLHLSKSELTMFKCKHCPYESKVPSYLYKHIVKHHEKKNRRN